MKDKTPHPEIVRGGNGKEKNVVVDERVEPINAANEGIEDRMQHDVGENDGGDDGDGSAFYKEGTENDNAPEGQPEQGEMRPVVMVKSLAVIDEVEVEKIDIRKNAGDESGPKIAFGVVVFL